MNGEAQLLQIHIEGIQAGVGETSPQLPDTSSRKSSGRQAFDNAASGRLTEVPAVVRAAEREISPSIGSSQSWTEKVPACWSASARNCRPSDKTAVKAPVVPLVPSLGPGADL